MKALRGAALLALLVAAPPAVRAAAAAEEPKIEVHSLQFRGVRRVDQNLLRSALATRVSSRLPWGKTALFDRAKFEADLERIRAYYVDRGFPDARVTSFDVSFDKSKTKVTLTITVEEGEPIVVTAIDFAGLEDVPPRDVQGLRRDGPLKAGEPLDRAALATMRESVTNALRDHGYPFPRVNAQVTPTGDLHAVKVTFAAETGAKAYFGPTEVTGTKEVSENLIRRELLYNEGDLYRRSVVQESQRKLYDLELFQFVSLRPDRGEQPSGGPREQRGTPAAQQAPGGDQQPFPEVKGPTETLPQLEPLGAANAAGAPGTSPTVPMRVTVTESKHRHVQFSAGYGTEENARVEGQFRQLNFFGGARTAAIRGKWSSLDRGVRLEFNNPYFFHPRWSLQLSGERWYDNEPAYSSVASGGHAVLTFTPGIRNSIAVTATDVYQSSEVTNAALSDLRVRSDLIALGLDPTTGQQAGLLNSMSLDARRTTATNPLNSTKGYMATVHLEWAGGWGSYAYTNASFELRHYLPLGRRLVVASRAQAGSLRPLAGLTSNVPFSKRYFLGGATSLRGWGRYELSPLSGSGLPIGGFSMFEASIEGRMSFTASLGGVLFVDLGNVWTDTRGLHFNDLRYDVGPGLRYNTPVGPLRVDIGYQLNPIPGLLVNGKPESRRWRIHLSIGQAF